MWKSNFFKRLPLQRKMMLSFALPVIIIALIGMTLAFQKNYSSSRRNIEFSVNQTGQQAVSFLKSYFQTMSDISDLLERNTSIRDVVFGESFLDEKTGREEYEEYQQLYTAIEDINIGFPGYRISIFLPDSVRYTANRYHIYPETELTDSDRYHSMEDQIEQGRSVFIFGEERNLGSGENTTYNALNLYRKVRGTEGGAFYISRVSIRADVISTILQNAGITGKEVAVLIDENGQAVPGFSESFPEEVVENIEVNTSGTSGPLMQMTQIQNVTYYYLLSDVIYPSEWRLLLAVPEAEIARQARRNIYYMLPILMLVILSIVLHSYLTARYYNMRLEELAKHMQQIQEGNLNAEYKVMPDSEDEFDKIAGGFNYMAEHIRRLMQEHYRMGKSVKSSELRALQAQINPHFLYNTLDLVNWMAMDFGTTEIADIAQNLARFYRLSLNRGRSILSIDEEIQHVQAYVNIENFHFSDAIRLDVNAEPKVLELGCPNIILQPFVENAIVHGIAEDNTIESCNIRINVEEKDGTVVFTIRDDGPGMSPEQAAELENAELNQATKGYGVKNINFRLKLYFGEEYGVHYESSPGCGTTVTTRIPAMSVTEMEELVR